MRRPTLCFSGSWALLQVAEPRTQGSKFSDWLSLGAGAHSWYFSDGPVFTNEQSCKEPQADRVLGRVEGAPLPGMSVKSLNFSEEPG